MPENKPINISVIPFVGNAKEGNLEPVQLFFNIHNFDGRFIEALSLEGFSASNTSRQFRPIVMPKANFRYELSDLNKLPGDHVYAAQLKPKAITVGTSTSAKKGVRPSEINGWPKGTYIFWLKIAMSPTDARPEMRRGSVLFEFEIE